MYIRVLLVTCIWKTANPSEMYKKRDSKSSSRVIMIHHTITHLEMSFYAHYLTRQTTSTEEIPFTAEIPDILNLMKQWFSCWRATVFLRSRLWICTNLGTILSYCHCRKKYYQEPFYRDMTTGKSQQKWKHHPQVHYGSCTQLERADKWFASIWKKHPQLLERLKIQIHTDTDSCKEVKRPQKLIMESLMQPQQQQRYYNLPVPLQQSECMSVSIPG